MTENISKKTDQMIESSAANNNAPLILLVEDDYFLRNLLLHKLNQEKFNVATAVNGHEALEKIKQTTPRVIILDLVLPDINGFEVLQKLKDDKKTKDITVIVVSNLGQRDEIEKCFTLGADDYLIKANFTPKEIVEKVKNYL